MHRRTFALAVLAAALAAAAFLAVRPGGEARRAVAGRAGACPRGLVREREAGGRAAYGEREASRERDAGECVRLGHPEGAELLQANASLTSPSVAPFHSLRRGAGEAAAREAAALAAEPRAIPGAAGSWTPLGKGALDASDTTYDATQGSTQEGFNFVTGRVEDFAYDAAHGRLYAAPVNGGVWRSTDMGKTWRPIGDGLPTQVVGSIAYTTAEGGTLIALTGDPAFGFDSSAGMGIFRSTDDGQTWEHAAGAPSGALGFQLAVDPTNPSRVYAATSAGLYRSTDDGRSWTDVKLPTGSCAGHTFDDRNCFLANIVTDVVVQAGSNTSTKGAQPGAVLAAVGWRAGRRANIKGKPESPHNGIYTSPTGAPGSFKFVDPTASNFTNGDPTAPGRIALGIANGPTQNHNIVYALVQDANSFNGEIGQDVLDEAPTGVFSTILNGVWVSTDFGQHWTEMESSNVLTNDQTSGSSLEPAGKAVSYEPGVQSWYNEWIQPDPTQTSATGAPTRVAFGLEEVWESDGPVPNAGPQPQDGPSTFRVIGRYWNACDFETAAPPKCGPGRGNGTADPNTFTTHPDQHAGLFVPDGKGGVTLVAGSDGGVFTQHVDAGQDFSNQSWSNNQRPSPGAQGAGDLALHTLQPYDVEMAKDGTAYMGLQDNGEAKILPDGTQKMVFGGDGFFTAVDPDNADIVHEEYAGGVMAASKNGGKTWIDEDPQLTSPMFSTPFKMDPTAANHLLVGGRDIEETTDGADTAQCVDPACQTTQTSWKKVYDLGTMNHPGDASAPDSTDPVQGDPNDPNNQTSAVELSGDDAYVGFCGFCDVMTQNAPFHNGIATNVAGAQPPKRGTSQGWHIAAARGLPNRFIDSIAVDPKDPETIFVALAGYGRHWAPPGSRGEDPLNVGAGHVFRSTDAGQHFTDITGDLPDSPANAVILRGDQVIVGTDVGAFISSDRDGTQWAPLGTGLPASPVNHLQLKPGDADTLVASTYGRGPYTYRFASAAGAGSSAAASSGQQRAPSACAAGAALRSASARPRGRGVAIAFSPRQAQTVTVDVFQSSHGRLIYGQRRVAHFRVRRSLRWNGHANVRGRKVTDGMFFVRLSARQGGRRDVRRIALRRLHGRFRSRPSFDRRESCGLVSSYKLESPVFGGRFNRAVDIAFRVSRPATVTVDVLRAGRLVQRTGPGSRTANRTFRIRLASERRARGDYRIRLTAVAGTQRSTATLVTRRL
ncbi:MAG: hypothetical protein E6G10_16085 [Actinobacteria bacterium]|nr:MAG: hypothetical protein E6G10_16085 [Actinomycetota bacterium]